MAKKNILLVRLDFRFFAMFYSLNVNDLQWQTSVATSA